MVKLDQKSPQPGTPGTTAQSPVWEGPPETRPSGYLEATDDPIHDRDALGETLEDPERRNLSEAVKVKGDDDTGERTGAAQAETQNGKPQAQGAIRADVAGRTGS
ncbi:hypothetical protein BTR14_17840 [Rhizobium rhizosphaerae]|uniref:Uncharacterized protein n=1 Tax=Xaviernesmea rhizosphaerae TaxID=1672749 RepID=A0ABX3PAS2_9HYPH|nr:hypothetical protein BTR14_17840 [Xaviernesmea rhizosphaerae]